MRPLAADDPIDYWREVSRRGVLSLGFSVARGPGGPKLVAALAEPLEGWARRAAYAAIAVHERAARSIDPPIVAARAVLALALEQNAATRPLAEYQALLIEAVWSAVQDDPPRRIETLSQAEPA